MVNAPSGRRRVKSVDCEGVVLACWLLPEELDQDDGSDTPAPSAYRSCI
jgi:hypothetical protein